MERKICLDKHALIFSVFVHNSFVRSFILTRTYMLSESNQNKDNVELRFYSVVTCLTLPILHNVFQSSMHAWNDLNLGVLFHYCTNFTFLCCQE